jgi:hypothetical protein
MLFIGEFVAIYVFHATSSNSTIRCPRALIRRPFSWSAIRALCDATAHHGALRPLAKKAKDYESFPARMATWRKHQGVFIRHVA